MKNTKAQGNDKTVRFKTILYNLQSTVDNGLCAVHIYNSDGSEEYWRSYRFTEIITLSMCITTAYCDQKNYKLKKHALLVF